MTALDVDRAVASTITALGVVMDAAVRTAIAHGDSAGMQVICDYLSDAGELPRSSDEAADLRAEVDRLSKALSVSQETVRRVADVRPVKHRCDRDGRAGWVRLRDLQEALKDGESR